MKYIVKYCGDFGFLKPWSAVRDTKTRSNFFLTPSVLMGIERKIFPELMLNDEKRLIKIKRYRLNFSGVSFQQETTQSPLYVKDKGTHHKVMSIYNRGVLVNPTLYLLFDDENDAIKSFTEHICLGRNEDLLYPNEIITIDNDDEFNDDFPGYESFECDKNEPNSILCGLNKYTKAHQYIIFKIFGTPSNFD